jgi:hypothetical protein
MPPTPNPAVQRLLFEPKRGRGPRNAVSIIAILDNDTATTAGDSRTRGSRVKDGVVAPVVSPAVVLGYRHGMPREIRRDEVRRLIDQGVQLVEVLPAKEYREDHLPGAISLPLRHLETDARNVLDVSRPVIVYCWDTA